MLTTRDALETQIHKRLQVKVWKYMHYANRKIGQQVCPY